MKEKGACPCVIRQLDSRRPLWCSIRADRHHMRLVLLFGVRVLGFHVRRGRLCYWVAARVMESRTRGYRARLPVVFGSGNFRQEHPTSPEVATPESHTDVVDDDK